MATGKDIVNYIELREFALEQIVRSQPGRTMLAVGSGPSLLDWPPETLREYPAVYMNSSIHRIDPEPYPWGVCRVMFDIAAITEKYRPDLERAPVVDTFFASPAWEGHKANPKLRAFMQSARWCFFEHLHCKHISPEGKIWQPTLQAAIYLCFLAGASEIHLVGVDFGPVDDKTHFDKQVDIRRVVNMGEAQRIKVRKHVVPFLKERGVRLRRFSAPEVEQQI